MFERFAEDAREVVVLAQEEARVRLRHAHIGAEHLLLGVAGVAPALVGADLEDVRAAVARRWPPGERAVTGQMPLTERAHGVLELAHEEAVYRGHVAVRPAHLLVVLLRAGGELPPFAVPREALLRRAETWLDGHGQEAADGPHRPLRSWPATAPDRIDVAATLRDGDPVAVHLGGGLPIGDLGHPRTDGQLLLGILAADRLLARMLREHGVDEELVRRTAGLGPERDEP